MTSRKDALQTTRSNILAAITDLFQLSMNIWISVKQHSIHDLLEIHDVSKNYATILVTILEDRGLLKTRGTVRSLEYMLLTDVTPDMGIIADECMRDWQKKSDLYKNRYKARKSSDLVQKRTPDQKDDSRKNGTPIITTKEVARRPIQIGDIKYMMYDNKIHEVRIIGIAEYKLEITYTINYNGANMPWDRTGVPLSSLFNSPEALIHSLINNITKYIKTDPKEIVYYSQSH